MKKFWTRRASPTPIPMNDTTNDPTDLTYAAFVEVVYDPQSKRLWINTEHGNVFRAYNIGNFMYRKTPERRHETIDTRTFDDNFQPVGDHPLRGRS